MLVQMPLLYKCVREYPDLNENCGDRPKAKWKANIFS